MTTIPPPGRSEVRHRALGRRYASLHRPPPGAHPPFQERSAPARSVPDDLLLVLRRGRAAVDGLRARLRDHGAVLHLLHGGRTDGAITIDEYKRSDANPDLADPASRRNVITVPHPKHRPTTAASCSSGPMATSTSVPGTAVQRIPGIKLAPRRPPRISGARFSASIRAARPRASTRSRRTTPSYGQPPRRGEIWSYGLRNPRQFSFDRQTGDLTIARRGPEPVGGDRLQSARLGLRSRRELRLELPRGPTRLRQSRSAVFRAATSGLHRARLGSTHIREGSTLAA